MMTMTMKKKLKRTSSNEKLESYKVNFGKWKKAAEKARDKEERDKAKRFSERICSGVFLKQPKAISTYSSEKEKKISQNGKDPECE